MAARSLCRCGRGRAGVGCNEQYRDRGIRVRHPRDVRRSQAGMRRFRGAGCHPDRGIALSRALTEAAQTRLTYVVGSRDDLLASDYRMPANARLVEIVLDALQTPLEPRLFGDVAGILSDDVAEDVRWCFDRLGRAGVDRIIVVDLTCLELGIPAVRMVASGLEGDYRNRAGRSGITRS